VLVAILLLVASGLLSFAEPSPSSASTPPTIAGCPALSANNIWNARVDQLPVHPRSADYLASMGLNTGLRPDFGAGMWNGGPIGIPYTTVPGGQARAM
jgi:hypothetical protein